MSVTFVWRIAGLVLFFLAGCGTINEILPMPVPPGGRELIVTVTNSSPAPVTLVVGHEGPGVAPAGAGADPSTVAAGATVEVRFVVPAGQYWAIIVKAPGGGGGTLVTAHDVPANAAGRMPFTIGIDARGEVYASHDGVLPGWFGQ